MSVSFEGLSPKDKERVTDALTNWLGEIEEGDSVKFDGTDLVFYNSFGCEIDRVSFLYE